MHGDDISNVMSFVKRNVKETTESVRTDARMKRLIGGEGDKRFYLLKTRSLGDRSLLEFIVNNGPRMTTQRDELLDLLAERIECFDVRGGRKEDQKTKNTIIENLKSGLPSSSGLTDCIKTTEEKFPITETNALLKYSSYVAIFLIWTILWSGDIATDTSFALEMFQNGWKNFTQLKTNCFADFHHQLDNVSQLCDEETTHPNLQCISFLENKTSISEKCRLIGPRFEDQEEYIGIGIYTVVHMILTLPVILILTAAGCFKSGCFTGFKRMPFPLISRGANMWNKINKVNERSGDNRIRRLEEIEARNKDSKQTINLSLIIEAGKSYRPGKKNLNKNIF